MKGSVLLVLASALLCMLLFTACQDLISDNLCLPGIDLEKLHTQLKQELPSGLKGYTYLIMKNGQVKFTRSKGYARSPSDGLQYWDEFQKMHVASISKTITTVATMRLLKVKGLSLDEKFSKYLPPDWEIGRNVSSLSFRDLMSHRTGFLDVVNEDTTRSQRSGLARDAQFLDVVNEDTTLSTVYDRLNTMVARGANGMKTRKYSNVHHALLRIILPILEDHPYTGGAIYDEARTARRYEQIVKLQVFVPLGIGGAALQDNDPNAGVLAYSSASDLSGVFETFDYRLRAGGYG
ncbi:MAG: serine hydrolase domain-containing protein [Rhodothermus sp.]|nr:serine hydrolase domain-containing protein [Rhodothermus sp.]